MTFTCLVRFVPTTVLYHPPHCRWWADRRSSSSVLSTVIVCDLRPYRRPAAATAVVGRIVIVIILPYNVVVTSYIVYSRYPATLCNVLDQTAFRRYLTALSCARRRQLHNNNNNNNMVLRLRRIRPGRANDGERLRRDDAKRRAYYYNILYSSNRNAARRATEYDIIRRYESAILL